MKKGTQWNFNLVFKTPIIPVIIVLTLFFLLAGCSSGTVEEVGVTILSHERDDAPLGCIGTNWRTSVVDDKGRLGSWCGKYGTPGMKVTGYYRQGHWDSIMNGLWRLP